MTPSEFRICPTNKLTIEWQLSSGQWGFFRICDSPADAKRSLAAINGNAEQMDLLEMDTPAQEGSE